MSKFVEKATKFLELLPIVATVAFSLFIIFKSQLVKLESTSLLIWVLGILTLLSTSILVDRFSILKRIEMETKEANEQLKRRAEKPGLDLFLSTRKLLEPLEERLKNANEIVITGGSLFRLTSEYIGFFESKAKDGTTIKFLLLNPDSFAAKSVAENVVYEIASYESYKNYINTSLNNINIVKKKYPNLIEVRTSDFIPSFSLMGTNLQKPDGRIMVELYTYSVPTRERPHFDILKEKDPLWYKFFLDQFNKMWENSIPVDSNIPST